MKKEYNEITRILGKRTRGVNMKLVFNKDGYISLPAGYKMMKMKDGSATPNLAAFQKMTSQADCVAAITISEHPMDFDDTEGLIAGIHEALDETQGLIEVDNGNTASGYRYIYSIVKTVRGAEGVLYYLRMNLELGETIYEINASFEEYGMTGMREVMIFPKILASGIVKDSEELMEKWGLDPYDRDFKRGVLRNMSEDKQFDGAFPEHPLTQARELIDTILSDKDSKLEKTIRLQILPADIAFDCAIEKESPKEKVKAFADKLKEKSPELKQAAAETASKLKNAADGAGDTISDTFEKLKEKKTDFDNEKLEKFKTASISFMKKSAKTTGKALKKGCEKGKEKIEEEKDFLEIQNKLIYKSLDSLEPVVNVVNEAGAALQDKTRNIKTSSIPDVLYGTLGAGIGGAISFAALYGLGTTGLSAAGITSGLAAAGGTMVGGIFVLAAPLAIGAGVGVSIAYKRRQLQLKEEKERLYKEALSKHEGIIRALEEEADADRERIEYLESLNILLKKAVTELKKDVDLANEEMQGI